MSSWPWRMSPMLVKSRLPLCNGHLYFDFLLSKHCLIIIPCILCDLITSSIGPVFLYLPWIFCHQLTMIFNINAIIRWGWYVSNLDGIPFEDTVVNCSKCGKYPCLYIHGIFWWGDQDIEVLLDHPKCLLDDVMSPGVLWVEQFFSGCRPVKCKLQIYSSNGGTIL